MAVAGKLIFGPLIMIAARLYNERKEAVESGAAEEKRKSRLTVLILHRNVSSNSFDEFSPFLSSHLPLLPVPFHYQNLFKKL